MSLINNQQPGNHHLLLNEVQVKKRDVKHLSIGSTKIQFLFEIDRLYKKLLVVTFIAIVMGFFNFLLLERTGLYSLGINSIFQSIARCVKYFLSVNGDEIGAKAFHIIFFWAMSIALNATLSILGYVKIGRQFTIITLVYIFVSNITSLSLASTPDSWGLKSFYIFSDPRTFDSCFSDKGINILQWNYISSVSSSGANPAIYMNDSSRVILIFFYGFFFGLVNTICALVVYAIGGSTGGTDWIIFYLSKKTSKTMTNIYLYMAIVITFISYIVGTFVPFTHHFLSNSCTHNGTGNGVSDINKQNYAPVSMVFGPMFISALIASFTKKIFFNIFSPQLKLVNVKIFTNKVVELRNALLEANFPHAFTINSTWGGYSLKRQTNFEVTCYYLELKGLRELTETIDSRCLIVATPIKSLSGRFAVRNQIN